MKVNCNNMNDEVGTNDEDGNDLYPSQRESDYKFIEDNYVGDNITVRWLK